MSMTNASIRDQPSSPREIWFGTKRTQSDTRSLRLYISSSAILSISGAVILIFLGLQREDSFFFFFLAGTLGGFGLGAFFAAQTAKPGRDSEVSELLIRIVTDLSLEAVPQIRDAPTPKLLESGNLDWAYLLARDPQLALAKVRIDLERACNNLRPVAEQSQFASFAQIVQMLIVDKIIDEATANALTDVVRICNYAVHGRFVPTVDDARSTLELAQRLLAKLSSLEVAKRNPQENSKPD